MIFLQFGSAVVIDFTAEKSALGLFGFCYGVAYPTCNSYSCQVTLYTESIDEQHEQNHPWETPGLVAAFMAALHPRGTAKLDAQIEAFTRLDGPIASAHMATSSG